MLCIQPVDQIPNHDVTEFVRLHGGSSSREGIVAMLTDDIWVTICSYRYDQRTADVVCRQLGYRGGAQEVVITDRFDYYSHIDTNILFKYGCLSLFANCRSQFLLNRLGRYPTVRIDCQLSRVRI